MRWDGITKEDRFWAKVDKRGPNECWPWTGAKTRGYGSLRSGPAPGRAEYAHRISYEMHIGPIPDGLLVLHDCDNPPCVNPAHLFLGTDADNQADKIAKGREARGDDLPQTKLSESDVGAVRVARDAGSTFRTIAKAFGISCAHAWRICNSKRRTIRDGNSS